MGLRRCRHLDRRQLARKSSDEPGEGRRLGVTVEADLAPLAAEDEAQTEPADHHAFTTQAVWARATLLGELVRHGTEWQLDWLVLPHPSSSCVSVRLAACLPVSRRVR
jgi:hypothetical protein